MNTLIDKSKDFWGIEKEIVIPNWGIATLVGLSAIVIGIAIYLYFKSHALESRIFF